MALIPWPAVALLIIAMLGGAVYVLAGALLRTRALAAQDRRALASESARARRAEQLAEALFAAAPVGVFIGDSDGTLRRANARLVEWLGYAPADLLAGLLRRRDLTPPEHQAKDEEALRQLARHGRSLPYAKEYLTQSGQRVPVQSLLARIGSGAQAELCEFVMERGDPALAVPAAEPASPGQAAAGGEPEERTAALFAVLDSVPLLMVLFSAAGEPDYVNAAWSQLLGFSVPELRERGLSALLPGQEGSPVALQQLLLASESDFRELQMRGKDGKLHDQEWNALRLPDGRTLCFGRDITLHKRADEALRRSEERERARARELETLMDAVPAAVWVAHDRACSRMSGNRASYELLRLPTGVNVSQTSPESERPRHFRVLRSGTQVGGEELPMQVAARQGVAVHDTELELLFDDAAVRFIYGHAAPLLDLQGQPAGAIGVFVDITERRLAEQALSRSEERFRSLVAASATVVWNVTQSGESLGPQPAWESYTGQSSTAARSEGWLQMVHVDDRPRLTTAWARAIAGRETFVAELRLFHHESGRHRYCLARGVPLREQDGSVREWIGTITDIDERRQSEEARARLLLQEQTARAEAERASRMKDEFLATVSHELRTPLTAIMGWVHMLRTETLDEKTQAMAIHTVERNAKAQAQLIEDILDVSRIITGKLRLQVGVVDLLSIVQAALDTVRPAAQSKDLELQLRTQLPPDERIVRGDPGRLQQVVWNLLANAIKFTPKGGRIDVTIDLVGGPVGGPAPGSGTTPGGREEPEAGSARLTVQDTGQGIEPDFLPFVFDRFRQADGTMTRKHGGLGLGLAIVRHLVELHGGSVRAKSSGPGQGAVFTVILPREILPTAVVPGLSASAGSSAERPARPADSPDPAPLRGLSILIVDDVPDTLRMLATLLEDAGARVFSAESARAALALIPQHRPDVLVSDLAMPGEDGFSLIAKVRALPPELGGETPAVALTAHVRLADRARALSAGFQMFITKPLAPQELISVLGDLARPRPRP